VRSVGERRALTINGIESIVGDSRRYFSTADDGCILLIIRDGAIEARAVMSPD